MTGQKSSPLNLSAFKIAKKDINFPGKDIGEEVFLVIRRHWIVYITHGLTSIVLLILPIIIGLLAAAYFNFSIAFPLNYILVLSISIFYLFLSTQFTISFMDYYFDIWLITNKRIIALEQKSLFNRIVSELALKNVQDITIEKNGILPTMLDFGTLFVQSAGKRTRFTFENAPRIYEIKEELNDLVHKAITKEHAEIARIQNEESQKETPTTETTIQASK